MTAAKYFGTVLAVAALIGFCAMPAMAVDGMNLPVKYAGSLAASQGNATGYGNGGTGTASGVIVPGSELDALYVTWDATDVWIGITGNLPDTMGSGQSIVLLIQDTNPGSTPGTNYLNTGALVGDGGGFYTVQNLNGLMLDSDFFPQYIIVINRAMSNPPGSKTYANAWYTASDPPFSYDWFDDLVSLDPNNGQYMSAYMDVTNLVGVTDDETKDGTGAGSQTELAATAVKGLRLRLSKDMFNITTGIKLMAFVASPGGFVSNQVLPPIPQGEDPAAPNCYGPDSTTWPDFATISGSQYATVDMSGTAPGTPTGFDGASIPTQWPTNTLKATQQLHTCFGDAHVGTVTYYVPGSELDQLFVRTDGTWLYVAISGNLEANGNRAVFFVDADPTTGENVLDNNTTVTTDPIYNWSQRSFDPDFAPEHCYMVNNSGGTFYADHYWLITDTKDWLGAGVVGSGSGVLSGTGAVNPNNDEFAFDNSNQAGVVGTGQPGDPGDPSTATAGLEARISLSELGITAADCIHVKVLAILGNQNGIWLSNQFLPSLAPGTGNINSDRPSGTPSPAFKFDGTDTRFSYPAPRFADAELYRLGDVNKDCCINLTDLDAFVQVLLGLDTTGTSVFLSDINKDGVANGLDVQPFVDLLLSQSPCP
jgi:hypothetical protein